MEEERVNPEMIVLARQSRYMTQRELAEALNIAQGTLSKIETGFLSVSDNLLSDLVEVLGYPKSFFFQDCRVYPGDVGFYRKHKTLPAKVLDGIVAITNIHRVHFEKLLRSAEISSPSLPRYDVDEHGSPEEIARMVRHFLRIPRGPIENMTKVMEDAGIAICPRTVPSRKFAGVHILTETAYYLVLTNADLPGDRWRFTLGHELGHIIMHSVPSADMEREADRFAAEFLMPEHDIKHDLYDIRLERLASLKRYWRVSMAAILERARHLDKITVNQHRYLRMQFSAAGYVLNEPPELAIPRENPSLLSELVDVHLNELGYSIEDLCIFLSLTADDFSSIYRPQKALGNLRLIS